MLINPNDLKQRPAFRHPEIFISLPSNGKFWDQKDTSNLPIYSCIAYDEILSRTPDALFSGEATVSLLKSCVPAIKDPWSIPLSDLETILIAVKIATSGNNLDLEINCEGCNESHNYELDLQNLFESVKFGNWHEPLDILGARIYFRPMNYRLHTQHDSELFKLRKTIYQLNELKNLDGKEELLIDLMDQISEIDVRIISDSIERIALAGNEITEKNYIYEFLKNCETAVFEKIHQRYLDLKKSLTLDAVQVTCEKCQKDMKVQLSFDDSTTFRNNLIRMNDEEVKSLIKKYEKGIKSIKEDLLRICWYMRGGLSYSEAINLTVKERELIATIVKDNMETTKKSGLPFF